MFIHCLSKLKLYRFRILAVFLLCVFLAVTWFTFHEPPQHSEELHISLRTQLKQLIQKTLSEKEPDANNVQFHKMWTEPTRQKNEITAQFEYSYDQQSTNVQVSGAAVIIKQSMRSQDYELWVVHSIRTDNWSIDFQEPVVLLSDKEYKTPESKSDSVGKDASAKVDKAAKTETSAPAAAGTAPEKTSPGAASAKSKKLAPSGAVGTKSKEQVPATTNTESGKKTESSEESKEPSADSAPVSQTDKTSESKPPESKPAPVSSDNPTQ